MRPTWQEYFLALADTASTRAACTRRQVGAVLVDSLNRVRSVGYNGVPSGETHCSDGGCPRGQLSYEECPPLGSYNNCKGLHAEQNAISAIQYEWMTGYTMYITREPCNDCCEAMFNEGITRAVWPDGERFF